MGRKRQVQEGGVVYLYLYLYIIMANSRCLAETNATLQSDYLPIKK